MNFPPAILCDTSSKSTIKAVLKNMKAMDARVSIRKVIKDERLPFCIDQWQLKWICKILNMTLRAGGDTALLYVIVHPENKDDELISLVGRENDIENEFRESDSVYVIDDNKILFVGFTTDETGLQILVPKIIKNIRNILQQNLLVKIGEAIFPRDGYSFYELIFVIQKRFGVYDGPGEKSEFPALKKELSGPAGLAKSVEEPKLDNKFFGKSSIYNKVFNEARGLFFQELITLDPELLWDGLRRLPITDQKLFCLRLSHDSPLTNILSEKIKTQEIAGQGIDIEKEMESLISRMDVDRKLIKRKKNKISIIAKLHRLEVLSNVPSVALEVYSVAMDPKSEIDDIQEIIQLDQVMTLMLLKLVNSPFYGLSQKVNSVKEAVIMLGVDEIINIAFGLSLSESFKAPGLGGLIEPRELWEHSVRTALIGKYLCREKKKLADKGVFAACILHDFGKFFFIENFPDEYRRVIELSEEKKLPVYDLEEEVFGYDHGAIGGMIAEKWNLPESLVQAVWFHHHPSSAANHPDLAAITGFASYLSNLDESKSLSNFSVLLKDHLAILQLIFDGFTIQSIEKIVENSKEFLRENTDVFSLL
ncbi:MAG: HDOD domain-containing protein [Desulfobacteraceae bacterium]|nr:HDOD domain-containing protein [Desulfobacteraceae bacterium]